MNNIKFGVYSNKEISNSIADIAVNLLNKQGKVVRANMARIKTCKIVTICYREDLPVAIGTIKKKTISDFKEEKANLPLLEKEFDWELGYFYTDDNLRGMGIATFIAKLLVKECGNINLIASTELFPKNGMIKILHQNGFVQIGNPWKSKKHDGLLGLFIKAKIGEEKKIPGKTTILPK